MGLVLFQNILQLVHTVVGRDHDHAVAELDGVVGRTGRGTYRAG